MPGQHGSMRQLLCAGRLRVISYLCTAASFVHPHTGLCPCRLADATAQLEEAKAAALGALHALQAVQHHRAKQPPPSTRIVADMAVALGACLTPATRSMRARTPGLSGKLAQRMHHQALECCGTLAQVRGTSQTEHAASCKAVPGIAQGMGSMLLCWGVQAIHHSG